MTRPSNIFAGIPETLDAERIETLLDRPSFGLERILSRGHATPEGEWYDQDRDEWVLLLKGSAALRIEGESDPFVLTPGDYLLLPAHVRHRVEWTDAATDTIWLALHF